MLKRISTVIVLTLSWAVQASPSVDSAEGYSIIPELTHRQQKPVDDYSVFDDVRLHGGVQYISSFQDLPVGTGLRERGGVRGFGLSFGIDLFSANWIAEGSLTNFPEADLGQVRVASHGFELRLLYDTTLMEALTMHAGAGIGNRSFTIKSKSRSTDIRAEQTYSSGASALIAGLDYWPGPQISLGVELVNHLPMANGDDPSSFDLGIRLGGHF